MEMILESGWPGKSRAGEDGAEAAWLVAQHAIGCPDFQRRCLTLVEEAVARGEAPAWQAAYLADRIRTLEGKGQTYGTQFDWDENGEMSPNAIERRAEIGLPPLADAIAKARRRAVETGEPVPPDRERRGREYEAWLKRVGWR
jgi:hypothetical protein